MYCTPIWKIQRVVFKAQIADSLIHKQQTEIRQLEGKVVASDSSASAAREAAEAAGQAAAHLENQSHLQEASIDYWQKVSRKWRRIAVAGGIFVIAELVAIIAQAVGD